MSIDSIGLRSIRLNSKDLSIIIVNYKSWEVLTKCLKSFDVYKPKINYEIIVVDNDSQDEKFNNFQKKFPKIKFIANSGNYGFSSGCNLGAENATGEYLLFLNPDTELNNDNSIDIMITFLRNHKSVGLVSCRTIMPNRIGGEISYLSPWLLIGWIRSIYRLINKSKLKERFKEKDSVWYPDWVGGSVMAIKGSLYTQIGKMDEKRYWMYYEDPDLCLRIRHAGKEVAIIRNTTINHIGGGASKTNEKNSLMLKHEMVISGHNYIHKNTYGVQRVLLLFMYGAKSLIPRLIKTTLTLPFFWTKTFKTQSYMLINISLYYHHAITHSTWKSVRLRKN